MHRRVLVRRATGLERAAESPSRGRPGRPGGAALDDHYRASRVFPLVLPPEDRLLRALLSRALQGLPYALILGAGILPGCRPCRPLVKEESARLEGELRQARREREEEAERAEKAAEGARGVEAELERSRVEGARVAEELRSQASAASRPVERGKTRASCRAPHRPLHVG